MDYGSNTRDMLVDTTPTDTLRQCVDYKMITGNRTYSRYIKLRRFWNKRNINWLPTSSNYPDAGTLIRQHATGFANNAILAKFYVTWYVKFKGLRV